MRTKRTHSKTAPRAMIKEAPQVINKLSTSYQQVINNPGLIDYVN
ncbi:MAG: hypothetical protein ABH827_06035 [bacterium]